MVNWERYDLTPDCSHGLDVMCRDCRDVDGDPAEVTTFPDCCRYEPGRGPVTMASAMVACETHERTHHSEEGVGE